MMVDAPRKILITWEFLPQEPWCSVDIQTPNRSLLIDCRYTNLQTPIRSLTTTIVVNIV